MLVAVTARCFHTASTHSGTFHVDEAFAYAFLQHRRLAAAKRGKKVPRAAARAHLPAVRHAIVCRLLRPTPAAHAPTMSALPAMGQPIGL